MHPDWRRMMPHEGDLALGPGGLLCGHEVFGCPRMPLHMLRQTAVQTSFCLSSLFICYSTRVAAKPQTTEKKVSPIKYTAVLRVCLEMHAHFKANHGQRHKGEPLGNTYFNQERLLRTPGFVRLNPPYRNPHHKNGI